MTNTEHRYHRPTDRKHFALTVTATGVTHCYPTRRMLLQAQANLQAVGTAFTVAVSCA